MPGLRAVCLTNPQTFLEAVMSHNSAVRTSTDDCKLLFMTTPFYKFIISFTNGSRKVFIVKCGSLGLKIVPVRIEFSAKNYMFLGRFCIAVYIAPTE